MVSVSEVKASNARISEETIPHIAVLYGATDGIGRAFLVRLVAANLPVRVYVVGRNGAKHTAFLDALKKSNPKADLIWLECQLSQLADTRRICDEIKKREKSLDLLYMSAGFIRTGDMPDLQKQNALGLTLALYGRILTITQLLPLLNASTSSSGPRVISVLAAGTESTSIHLEDLEVDFAKPLSRAAATCTTVSMAKLARENPHVVFVHHYPGGVNTGLFEKTWGGSWWFPLLSVLMNMFGTSPEDAGEKILCLATSARFGGKGVPLTSGQSPALTMARAKEPGALFDVDDKLKGLQQEKVMAELKSKGAEAIIWKKVLDTIGPYSS